MGDTVAHPLAGIEAKIDRGFEHLAELEAEVGSFFRDNPYRIAHERDGDTGWHIAAFRIDHEPPIRLGIVAGEALGQFRSALDHLTTQMAILRRPGPSTRHDNFPIHLTREEFLKKPGPGGKSPRARIRHAVRPAHFALIESWQPYQPVQRDPTGRLSEQRALAVLQWFTNLDKHELVRPAFVAAQGIRVHQEPNVSGFDWTMDPEANLHDETHLYRVQFMDESKMDMDKPMRLTIDLTFGEGSYPWVSPETVLGCGDRIRDIVESFRRITPEFA
jgi:hypothetical protein